MSQWTNGIHLWGGENPWVSRGKNQIISKETRVRLAPTFSSGKERFRKHWPLLKGDFREKVKSRLTYRYPHEHMLKILFYAYEGPRLMLWLTQRESPNSRDLSRIRDVEMSCSQRQKAFFPKGRSEDSLNLSHTKTHFAHVSVIYNLQSQNRAAFW